MNWHDSGWRKTRDMKTDKSSNGKGSMPTQGEHMDHEIIGFTGNDNDGRDTCGLRNKFVLYKNASGSDDTLICDEGFHRLEDWIPA